MYICVFRAFGLAKPKRVAPKPIVIESKKQIDGETLRALISNRFQVMSYYTNKVLMPVFKQEQLKADIQDLSLWKKTKRLLGRQTNFLDKNSENLLSSLLTLSSPVREAYSYRERLQNIWEQTTATQKELLEDLHEWCQAAEASGVQALQDFSAYLKSYALTRTVL